MSNRTCRRSAPRATAPRATDTRTINFDWRSREMTEAGDGILFSSASPQTAEWLRIYGAVFRPFSP